MGISNFRINLNDRDRMKWINFLSNIVEVHGERRDSDLLDLKILHALTEYSLISDRTGNVWEIFMSKIGRFPESTNMTIAGWWDEHIKGSIYDSALSLLIISCRGLMDDEYYTEKKEQAGIDGTSEVLNWIISKKYFLDYSVFNTDTLIQQIDAASRKREQIWVLGLAYASAYVYKHRDELDFERLIQYKLIYDGSRHE